MPQPAAGVLAANVTDSAVRVGLVGVVIPSNRPAWARIGDPLAAARRRAAAPRLGRRARRARRRDMRQALIAELRARWP